MESQAIADVFHRDDVVNIVTKTSLDLDRKVV